MNSFIQRYDDQVTGQLSGWDRLVFRGTLRMLCFAEGMMGYLSRTVVLLKPVFYSWPWRTRPSHDRAFDQASLAAAEEAGRPVQYLASPRVRKGQYALSILLDDSMTARSLGVRCARA